MGKPRGERAPLRRLDALREAHAPARGSSAPSPRVEDYVEVIYELIEAKGYARVVDIGAHLHVASPSATKMVQRLSEAGLVVYERYRGITLTPAGAELARAIHHRHGVVSALLEIVGVDPAIAHRDTEGIEHHLDASTLRRLARLVAFARENPEWWARFRREPA